MRQARKSFILLLAALTGCQSVFVESIPYGAEVYVDGERVGVTPCKFSASTVIGCEYLVEVRLRGYQPYSQLVESEWGPGSTWNLLASLIFLSPLIILTPFFGDIVPGGVFAPLQPLAPQTALDGPVRPEVWPRADEEVH